MKKIAYLILFLALLNLGWGSPRPKTAFIASMDALPASSDTHSVGSSSNWWENGYFQTVEMRYRAEQPDSVSSYGAVYASTDGNVYFKNAAGTNTKLN